MTNTPMLADSQSKPTISVSNEIENALCDMEVARTFRAAADNFLDEMGKTWLGPNGICPNALLLSVVHHAQTMLSELGVRADNAEKRMETALREFGHFMHAENGGAA